MIKNLFKISFALLLATTLLNAGFLGDTFKGAAKAGAVYGVTKALKSDTGKKALKDVKEKIFSAKKEASGRVGRQKRLQDLAGDDKSPRHVRGWIKQEQNSIKAGNRKNIRNPIGKELAHKRGREASKGYDYEHTNLQDKDLHKLQHKYDNFGKKNKENKIKDKK